MNFPTKTLPIITIMHVTCSVFEFKKNIGKPMLCELSVCDTGFPPSLVMLKLYGIFTVCRHTQEGHLEKHLETAGFSYLVQK